MRLTREETAQIEPHLLDLYREAFGSSPEYDEDLFKTVLSEDAVFISGVRDDNFQSNPPTGYAIVGSLGQNAYLKSLAVKSQYRNMGYGMVMMREIDQAFREKGITLHVNVDNPAQKFYFDAGYRVTGFARNFYTDRAHALVMRRIYAKG